MNLCAGSQSWQVSTIRLLQTLQTLQSELQREGRTLDSAPGSDWAACPQAVVVCKQPQDYQKSAIGSGPRCNYRSARIRRQLGYASMRGLARLAAPHLAVPGSAENLASEVEIVQSHLTRLGAVLRACIMQQWHAFVHSRVSLSVPLIYRHDTTHPNPRSPVWVVTDGPDGPGPEVDMTAPLGDWGMNLNEREVLSFLGMWCPFLEDAIFLHLHWPPIIDAISPGRYRVGSSPQFIVIDLELLAYPAGGGSVLSECLIVGMHSGETRFHTHYLLSRFDHSVQAGM